MNPNTADIRIKMLVAALAFGASAGTASAALTDISQTPLASSGSNLVKPNILFILDRSGSMAWTHAPDEAQPFFDGVGYKSSQCNSIYYNPSTQYVVPRAYDGSTFANASYTAAINDGFCAYDGASCSSTTNLSTSFKAYTTNSGAASSTSGNPDPSSDDTAQQAYYYVYTGSQTAIDTTGNNYQHTSSTFYKECNAAESSTGGPTASITFSGSTDTIVNQISVGGVNIMSGPTAHTTSSSTLASSVAALITLNGYSATASGSKVTIVGPGGTAGVASVTPVITATPPFTYSTLTFTGSGNTSVTSITVNGNEITTPPSAASSNTTTEATNTAAIVNQLGYSALTNSPANNVITLQAPYSGTNSGLGFTPVVTVAGDQKSTLTFSGSGTSAVSKVMVNGTNILTGTTASATTTAALAAAVAAKVGNGYTATYTSGSSLTITQAAPATGAVGQTPTVTVVPGAPQATLTFSGSGSTIVTQVLVNGVNILGAATSASTSTTTVASNVAAGIGGGYTATSSGAVVTITGPAGANGFSVSATTTPGTSTGTLTVSGSTSSTVVSASKAGTTTISTGATSSQSTAANLASAIQGKIGAAGCTATVASTVVTVTCGGGLAGQTLSSTKSSGSLTITGTVLTGSTPMTAAGTTFAQGGSLMSGSGTAFAQQTKMTVTATAFPAEGVMTATIVPFSPFYRVQVSSTSGPGGTDERQNFANWYTYYRTRLLMMKSGMGRAFVGLGPNYRVGFMTINVDPANTAPSYPDFVAVNDFSTGTATATSCTSPQKCYWFRAVYKETVGGGTPLKAALSNGARYLAGRFSYSPQNSSRRLTDPGQYSCQQNFILMSTDGYWNADPGSPWGKYGSNLTGGSITGDLDGVAGVSAPQYDGNHATATLADVAQYYYTTDLRDSSAPFGCATGVSGADMCADNVPVTDFDKNPKQHITLFTLGLGTNGQLRYDTDYLDGKSIDYNAILSGSTQWPTPVGDELTTIDDLWHAAVNGHGQYFSAKNPDLLVSGIQTALSKVSARLAAGAAAATSNLEPVAGDNFAFVASYTTKEWTGDLQSRTINLTSGAISSTPNWSAQANLDGAVTDTTDTRNIMFNSGTASSPVLSQFLPANFSSTQKSNWFTPSASPQLSQYAGWTSAQVALGTADTVINFLRGQTGYEERAANITAGNGLYRVRNHVLGDIIDGKPVYMRLPPFNYNDPGYSTFKTSSAVTSRTGMVYVGGNDGMLHAFDSGTGNEIWAYVPTAVLGNLKSLADDNYTNAHLYYVDGSPVVTDIYNGSAWKTILVSGLGAGGKAFFAMDVTDPVHPTLLWEYTDTNLGYSFGNPVIGKLTNGTWVVAFTSGYNNVGDGVGRLYVLNAWTGTQLFTISTGTGSATSPSGLNKISAWVDNGLADNTIQRIYGGDQFGNLWRFDINDQYGTAGKDALALANFQVGTYQQPITTAPELGLVNGVAMVYTATGRYLGASDVSDLNQQSLYAIVDKLTGTGLGDARTETTCPLVVQTLTVVDVNTRSTSTLPVDLTTNCGWYLDFNPTGGNTPGERVNVDPKLQLGVLAVATNIPDTSVCTVGGSSFLYFFDYSTGRFVSTATNNVAGTRIANALAVGVNTYQLPSGQVVSTVTTSDDQHPTFGNPSNPNVADIGKRVMWRELLN